jgi:hypothetical protein
VSARREVERLVTEDAPTAVIVPLFPNAEKPRPRPARLGVLVPLAACAAAAYGCAPDGAPEVVEVAFALTVHAIRAPAASRQPWSLCGYGASADRRAGAAAWGSDA